jgi:hypothetical protein
VAHTPITEESQLRAENISEVFVEKNNTTIFGSGNNASEAINVEDEIPNLNEIIYDGEVVIESDDENVPPIDFFGAQVVIDDDNNTNVDYMDIKIEGENTRKRKRGFSLEGLRLRRVKPKIEQNEISPEISSPLHADETLEDIDQSIKDNPILRAIYSARLRKNNNNNNNNNQRRASSYENRIKIEKEADSQEECPDSTRVLVYAERHTPGRRGSRISEKKMKEKPRSPKKATTPKKEIKGEKKRIKSEEGPEAISSDDDSVEYHVDKLCDDEYFVEEILEKKVTKGKTKYLIKWLGWPHEDVNTLILRSFI